jgi:hypothetical protein
MGVVMTERHRRLPRAYMRGVGAIVFYWATFEFELMDIIGEALDIGLKERRMLMARSNPKAKSILLKTIASHFASDRELKRRLIALSKTTTKLFDIRNKFAHGPWVYPKTARGRYDLLVMDTGEDAYLPRRLEVTTDGLHALEDDFQDAVDEANTVLGMVRAAKKGPQGSAPKG